MKSLKKLVLVILMIIVAAVLIILSVVFYNQGESSNLYSLYPPMGGIGIILGVAAIIIAIVSIKNASSDRTSSSSNTSHTKTTVELDPSLLNTFDEKKTYQLSIGYTDGKENKCIDAMKKYGWTLVRKNEFNLTLYFERETESLEIEKMLLPIAIRMNNDDDRFLEERKNHIYASMELAKRLYNQRPSEIDTARYAGSLLASAMSTDDFPFKDIYEEAQEQVRTRVEKKKVYTNSSSYSSSDYSYSSGDYDLDDDGISTNNNCENESNTGDNDYNNKLEAYDKYNGKYAIYLERYSFPNYHGYYVNDGWGDAFLTDNIEEAKLFYFEIDATNEAIRLLEKYSQYDDFTIKKIDVYL